MNKQQYRRFMTLFIVGLTVAVIGVIYKLITLYV